MSNSNHSGDELRQSDIALHTGRDRQAGAARPDPAPEAGPRLHATPRLVTNHNLNADAATEGPKIGPDLRGSEEHKRRHRGLFSHLGGAAPSLGRLTPRRRTKRKERQEMRWALVIVLLVTMAFGLIMLFSTSMTRSFTEGGTGNSYIVRQLVFTAVGMVLAYIISRMDLSTFNRRFPVIVYWGVTLILLVATLIPGIGRKFNGHRRWLPVTSTMSWQPSELAKIGIIYISAFYYDQLRRLRAAGLIRAKNPRQQKWLDGFLDVFFPFLFFGAWWFVIAFQSHMSVIIIMIMLLFLIMISVGVPLQSFLTGGSMLLALVLAGVLIIMAIKPILPEKLGERWDHMAQRVMIFTESDEATKDDTWQQDQAELAIGSGGLFGAGIGQGKQKYNYLPEGHNDYIFSNIVEEVGFFGGLTIMLLFLLILLFGLQIAYRSPTLYDFVLAVGSTYLLTLQAFLSIGVNVGVVIPTGISLPFFSYGGSGNLFFLIAVGLLLNTSRHHKPQSGAPVVLMSERGI